MNNSIEVAKRMHAILDSMGLPYDQRNMGPADDPERNITIYSAVNVPDVGYRAELLIMTAPGRVQTTAKPMIHTAAGTWDPFHVDPYDKERLHAIIDFVERADNGWLGCQSMFMVDYDHGMVMSTSHMSFNDWIPSEDILRELLLNPIRKWNDYWPWFLEVAERGADPRDAIGRAEAAMS